MNGLRLVAIVSISAVPLGAGAGTPGTLTPVTDDRSIAAFGEPVAGEFCGPIESFGESPAPAFSFFNDTVSGGDGGFASQTSSVGTGVLDGSAFASGYSDLCYGIGNSTYDVTFTLNGWAELALSGSLDARDTLGFGFAETTARLTRGAQVLYQEVTDPFRGPVALSYSAKVPPGTYRLFLEADGDVSIDSSWSFTLDADPGAAPVPSLGSGALATLLVMLAGAGGAAARRSRWTASG